MTTICIGATIMRGDGYTTYSRPEYLLELYQDSWDDQMVLLVCNHLNLIKQFGQMLFVLICYNEKDSSFHTAFKTRARGWCSPWDRFWQSLVIANFAKLITFVNRQRILLRSTDSNMQLHNICVSYCILIVIIHNSLWTYSNLTLASITCTIE